MSKFKIIIIVSCIFVVCVGLAMLATLFNKIPYTIFWREPVKTKCCCSDMLDEISEVLSEYGEIEYDEENDTYSLETDSVTIDITFNHGNWRYNVYWYKDYYENPENPYTDSELKDICRLINILSDKNKSKITEENILEFISAPEEKYDVEKVGR